MKQFALILSLAILWGCGGHTPPKPPQPTTIWDFSISVSDPAGQLQGGSHVAVGQAETRANDFGWAYFTVQTGCYDVRVSKEGFNEFHSDGCVVVDRHKRLGVVLVPTAPPTPQLEAKGKIFYQQGQAWRWKGLTAFGLANRYCKGEDITDFLGAAKGFNLLRVFYYWETIGAAPPSDGCLIDFTRKAASWGFYVELVLLTGPKPLSEAQALVNHLFELVDTEPNVLLELVNEPGVHDKVDPNQLQIPQGHNLWTDGLTIAGHRGFYLTPHTARDPEWPRHAHDLHEYYIGGGPGSPSDPAFHEPATGDEPAKLEDVGGCNPVDWEGYFGAASLLGAGATFHFESGKYGHPPTPAEAVCMAAALRALDFYPADAPLGPYSRIDENGATLRTYVVGPYKVRVRPIDGLTLVPWQ